MLTKIHNTYTLKAFRFRSLIYDPPRSMTDKHNKKIYYYRSKEDIIMYNFIDINRNHSISSQKTKSTLPINRQETL